MTFSRITVNANQMGGVPCIRGLRIPVAAVVGMVADGMTEEEILKAFPDLEPEDIRQLEPAASPALTGGMHLPRDHQVHTGRLMKALARALARRGVRVLERTPVTALRVEGDRAVGVLSPRGPISSPWTVLAAGPWSGQLPLAGAPGSVALPVEPVRGQLVWLAPQPPPLRHTLVGDRGYLVPKREGVVVGATMERAGFRRQATAGGVARLLQAAVELLPGLAEAPFRRVAVGLRPGTPDGLPILGGHPAFAGLVLACGHLRNGILLAPATARIVAALLVGAAPPLPLEPFALQRFGLPAASGRPQPPSDAAGSPCGPARPPRPW